MKAICNNRIFKYVGSSIFVVEDGEVVDYIADDNNFIVNGFVMNPIMFLLILKF